MRILIITNLYPPEVLGGYEILCAQVVASLVKRGHKILVLTTPVVSSAAFATGKNLDTASQGSPAVRDAGTGESGELVLRTLRLHLPFSEQARLDRVGRQRVEGGNRKAAIKASDQFKPDVVFVWSQLRMGLGAARACEKKGLPVVYTMNDDHILGFRPMPSSGIRGIARTVAERIVFPASTYRDLKFKTVAVISDTVRRRLTEVDPRFAGSLIAFQGVPIEKYPLKPVPGAASDPFRLLYAGQLHEYKGVHTLLEAAGILASRGRYSLTIAGAGTPDYETRLKSRAAELGLAVNFLGRVPSAHMGSLYREADLLAFTSIWDEPFGLTHLEAMASGTPVVSVGHGGPGEFLKDGKNALIFEKDNPESLARAIERIATNPELRLALAREGRRTVEEGFTLERYTDRLEAILEGAVTDALSVRETIL